MKNNKVVTGLYALAVIIQMILINNYSDHFYIYSFAVGMKNTHFDPFNSVLLFYIMIPLAFIVFAFSEGNYSLTHGYGKLLIIREYSKTKLMLTKAINIFICLIPLILYQGTVFYFGKAGLSEVNVNIVIRSIMIYYFGVFAILLLQFLLEFYISPELTNALLIIYCFISYSLTMFFEDNIIINILFFPYIMTGTCNGAFNSTGKYFISLLQIIIICFILLFFNIRKINKADIF